MYFLILLLNLNIICVNKTLLHKPKLPPVRRCYEGQGVHTKISQRNLFLAEIWQLWFPFRAAVTTVYTTWQGGYQQYHWVCLLDRSKSQISCKTNYLQENIKELKALEIKLANQHSRVQSYIQQSQRNCLNILQKRQILLSAKGKKKKKSPVFHSLELKSSDYSHEKYILLCNRRYTVPQHFTKAFVNEVLHL